MGLKENDTELEIIAVKIGNRSSRNYGGLAGTFASFVYCCLDKKVIPGFHDTGLIKKADLEDGGLMLILSGKYTENELMEVMDIAMPNIGAFPVATARAKYVINVKSKN
jgi:hypothetical protein